jgi:uncharacterized membrane protein YobD (UPF0266 family)
MIRFLLLGAGILFLVLGTVYTFYYVGRIKGTTDIDSSQGKKGLIAALGFVLLGVLLIFSGTRKK